MPRKSPYTIVLSEVELKGLEKIARKYSSPYRDVLRAKIILLAAQGLSNDIIAPRLDTSRQIVSKWRKRFFAERLPGIQERLRKGRPVTFSPSREGGSKSNSL
jgi:transposase